MWNRYGMAITAISLGVTASLVSYEFAQAARIRNYTPREMRAALSGFGYNVTLGDAPLTDKATMDAIRQFQKGYKITVDGIAGPQTQDLMADLVMILQANLNLVVRPNPPLPRTQYYGAATEAVVKQYQQQAGLPVTGTATLEVRQKLDDEATRILNNQSTPTPRPRSVPTPTPSPTPTPTPTPSPTPSPTASPKPTPRAVPTPSPTITPRALPTPSPTAVPRALPTQSPTTLPSPSLRAPSPTPRLTPLPSPGSR